MRPLVILKDGDFFRHVLSSPVPILCFFQDAFAQTSDLDRSVAVVDRALWKLIDGYAMRMVIVNGHLTPRLVRQHCRTEPPPLLRLYRFGRVLAGIGLDARGVTLPIAAVCRVTFQAALEAPWNQPGVEPEAFRMPQGCPTR